MCGKGKKLFITGGGGVMAGVVVCMEVWDEYRTKQHLFESCVRLYIRVR